MSYALLIINKNFKELSFLILHAFLDFQSKERPKKDNEDASKVATDCAAQPLSLNSHERAMATEEVQPQPGAPDAKEELGIGAEANADDNDTESSDESELQFHDVTVQDPERHVCFHAK